MSIKWIDVHNTIALEDDDIDEDNGDEGNSNTDSPETDQCHVPDSAASGFLSGYDLPFEIKVEAAETDDSRYLPFAIKVEAVERDDSHLIQVDPQNRNRMKCPSCDKSFHPASYHRHRLTTCRGKKRSLEKTATCQYCSKDLLSANMARHYSTCRGLTRENSGPRESTCAKPKFSSRKVIDISGGDEVNGSSYKSSVCGQSSDKADDDENDQDVHCPECHKSFSDTQGRDEHLVYHHHYHFRIKFSDRETFKKWFKGMRFDQIMYKANMSTVNGVTYEYYFCLYTAVNRRVRIRDRCPCRAFVKENDSGITVSYLDVHSHPQLKYKRYMTEECRTLILRLLEEGKKNKDILKAVKEQFSESSINYTIARTTINSIRFKYKKKVWASRHVDIEELKRTLKEEVALEKQNQILSETSSSPYPPAVRKKIVREAERMVKMDVEMSDDAEIDDVSTADDGTQTDFDSNATVLSAIESFPATSTHEETDEIRNNILQTVIPNLELAIRCPNLTADQLHTARVHLLKLAIDLNPTRRKETDHDYTYLSRY